MDEITFHKLNTLHKTRLIFLIVLMALFVFLLTGCISITTTGQSTGDMKDMISESQFYHVSKLFFPDDKVNNTHSIPTLDAEQLDFLQADLEKTLRLVLKLHNANHKKLRRYFGDNLLQSPEANILLTNLDLPEAQTVASGEISIDVRVLQSTLRSALLNAYQVEIDLHRIKTGADFSAQKYTAEEENIAVNTFLKTRKQLEQTPGRTIIGDLRHTDLKASQTGQLDWFEMNDVIKEFNKIEVRYATQELFLLAHEVGHIVLGHFEPNPFVVTDKENDPDVDACSLRRSLERAADIYASILITISTSGNVQADFLGMFGQSKVSSGFDTFFSYAYGYAGFQNAEGVQRCNVYPSPEQRLAVIMRFYDNIREEQIDAILKTMEKGS